MNERKLGLGGLTAIVFSMMVGSGIFNIPQNIARGAGLGSSLVAWAVTAVAMLSLVYTFRYLSRRRPDLKAGIYEYAEAGFGHYAGFNMAWGYWLCVCFANVAYAVMLNDSFGAFFPSLLRHDWRMVLFGTVLIWGMYLLVSNGLKTAKQINNIMTVLKLVPIVMIIALLILCCNTDLIIMEWPGFDSLDDMLGQTRDSMMVTLWCFIGIEGAVMMSARARRSKDVGRAGVLGFMTAWLLYVVISTMCFGVMTRERLAGLEDPSVAYLLRSCQNDFWYWFVIVSVIISVLGSWVSWTLVCAQVPMEAAIVKIFPGRFSRLNKHDMPAFGLKLSSIAMTICLIIVAMADDVYMAALQITGMMVLPCYLFSGLYLCKIGRKARSRKALAAGTVCVISCLWMLYSAGTALIATSLFYLVGTPYFMMKNKFTRYERVAFVALIVCAVFSIVAFAMGWIEM